MMLSCFLVNLGTLPADFLPERLVQSDFRFFSGSKLTARLKRGLDQPVEAAFPEVILLPAAKFPSNLAHV